MMSSSASSFLISFLIFLCFLSQLSAQNPTCHPQDQIAINQIKTAFGINPTGDCCDWTFVVCDSVAPFRVIQFEVYNSDISGQIPAAIGDLSFLKVLTFNNVSKLTGNIPSTIANLSQLASLSITQTSVSGPIPRFPQNLNNLIAFLLPSNSLTGSIPPEISTRFPNLEQLDLHGNQLTGSIPESFGLFPKSMFFINLSHNFLTGTIPNSLANLDLAVFDLSQNKFSGDASFLFGKNKQTQTLYLFQNNFTFDLSNVEFPSQLTSFDVSHNNIFGTLQQQLTQFKFTRFSVSFNQLCGPIPQGGTLQSFRTHSYYHNKCLCGAPLPACKK